MISPVTSTGEIVSGQGGCHGTLRGRGKVLEDCRGRVRRERAQNLGLIADQQLQEDRGRRISP